MLKEELHQLLTDTITEVTFEKTDGTIRSMKCTLIVGFLPTPTQVEEALPRTKRESNPDILAVWDLDKGDWRSFRIASVKEVNILYPQEREGVYYAASTQE